MSDLSGLISVKQNVLFHLLKVNIVVEFDYVLLLTRVLICNAFSINCLDMLFETKEFRICVDYEVECNVL